MELLLLVAEGLLWLVDLLAMGADLYAWFKGKPNRVERKEARKAGLQVPPRDQWNRRVITLTAIVSVSTVALFLWKS